MLKATKVEYAAVSTMGQMHFFPNMSCASGSNSMDGCVFRSI